MSGFLVVVGLVVAALISPLHATALTYQLAANEKACFFAETSAEQVNAKIAFYFAVQSGGSFDIDVTVTGPNAKPILTETSQRQGDYVFTAQSEGEYAFCLSNPSSTFTDKLVDLEIAIENESRSASLPQKQGSTPEQTSALQDAVSRVSGHLSTVGRMQKYFRTRENRNFSTVRSTEGRIWRFSLVEVGMMAGMAGLQVAVVRFFFQGARKGMSDLIRDAPIGQLIRWVTGKKYLLYPEERPDFKCPYSYEGSEKTNSSATIVDPTSSPEVVDEKLEVPHGITPGAHSLATPATIRDTEDPLDQAGQRITSRATLSQIVSRPHLEKAFSRADLEQVYTNAAERPAMKRLQSVAVEPQTKADGTILVDWYTTDDPENPQNWSEKKKALVVLQIYLYTLAVYMGSAIYVPSVPYLMEIFGINQIVASLGLALYVLGYGIGPLIFAPLSEIPAIGRNPPYMITFGIFVILCIPTALAADIPGLLVLRFLQGFFGSPCLATGGASIGDLYSLLTLPYFLTGWAAFATCGPALGPLISGFSVPARNWRWSLWEMLWLSGPVFVSLFFLLPETNSATILLRRAERLRKSSGNQNVKSQAEIDQANLSLRKELIANLWHPIQINVLDPAVLFTSVYVGLIYAIFYSFFEVFPIVYAEGGYGFSLGQLGLVFLCISVAVLIAIPTYFVYLKKVWVPYIMTKGLPPPERALIPALFVVFLPPAGLFLFAWTARDDIHWIVPTIGVTIFTGGIFILLQCIFVYIPMNYPQYAASLFAFNDFFRSSLAFAAILFSYPLFHDLGVAKGVSLLAALTTLGVVGIFVLYIYGPNLRARSRFTAK